MNVVTVRFDAEIKLLDAERPEFLSYETVAQAVQNEIGHTGAVVIEVTDYEESPEVGS